MDEMVRSIGFVCPECGKTEQRQLSVFNFSGGETEIPCRSCGKTKIKITRNGDRFLLTTPCIVCGEKHTVMCSAQDFLYEPILAFSCVNSGMDCCYVGREDIVKKGLIRLVETLNAVGDEAEQASRRGPLKETILFESMQQISDRADRGLIHCECGSRDWDLDVRGGRIDVICMVCGGRRRLSAVTLEDLETISAMKEIVIKRGGSEE